MHRKASPHYHQKYHHHCHQPPNHDIFMHNATRCWSSVVAARPETTQPNTTLSSLRWADDGLKAARRDLSQHNQERKPCGRCGGHQGYCMGLEGLGGGGHAA